MPPNLLVGPGATEFASEVGIPVVLPGFLVSTAAGERYARWKEDLTKANNYEETESDKESDAPVTMHEDNEPSPTRDAHNVELAGCWNESQPFSPRVGPTDSTRTKTNDEVADGAASPRRRSFWSSNEPGNDGQSSIRTRYNDDEEKEGSEDSFIDDSPPKFRPTSMSRNAKDTSSSELSDFPDISEEGGCRLPSPLIQPPPTRAVSPSSHADPRLSGRSANIDEMTTRWPRQDDITDTVGAIAVDCLGNIAAGSSSGGIGMKHKGRVGPAALVGIGTAVIPCEPEDKEKTSVATVTSGTGEHMATTMAAGVCASRLYTSTRRTGKGESESTDDDSAIRAFVEKDFMGI